jgi:hypothetical protein
LALLDSSPHCDCLGRLAGAETGEKPGRKGRRPGVGFAGIWLDDFVAVLKLPLGFLSLVA